MFCNLQLDFPVILTQTFVAGLRIRRITLTGGAKEEPHNPGAQGQPVTTHQRVCAEFSLQNFCRSNIYKYSNFDEIKLFHSKLCHIKYIITNFTCFEF